MESGIVSPGTAFGRDTDSVVVASVICTAEPVRTHVPGLPDCSGDCYESYGGGGLTINPTLFITMTRGSARSGVNGVCLLEFNVSLSQ